MYKVLKFIIHKLPDESIVLQNEISTTIIDDYLLIDFLTYIDNNGQKKFERSLLQEWFHKETEDVLQFMLSNRLVIKEEKKNTIYKNVYIISDDEEISELLYRLLEFYPINVEKIGLESLKCIEFNTNTLIIGFFNGYNRNKIMAILKLIEENDSLSLLLSYNYRHSVYFDCIYSRNLMTPCHQCIKGIIDGQIYEEYEGPTYNQLLNMIYKMDDQFEVKYPLEFRHKISITNQINRQINGLIPQNSEYVSSKHHQDFTDIYKLDLRTLQIFQDNAIFWEMCDCYERV